MPKGFKLNSTTHKYEGLEEPEGWLEDYLIAVKFQCGTNTTTRRVSKTSAEELATRLHQLLEAIPQRVHRELRVNLQATIITRRTESL